MTSYRLDRPYLPRTSVLGRSLCVVATALPLGLLTGLAGTATGWEPVIALQALYGCAGAAWVAGIRARPRLRRVAAAVRDPPELRTRPRRESRTS